jgi:glycine oxidase
VKKIAIIGSGVAGLCAAKQLCENPDLSITLFNKHPSLHHSCSWLAGGMLAPWCEQEHCDYDLISESDGAIAWWQEKLRSSTQHPHNKTDIFQKNGTLVIAQPRDMSELDYFAQRTLSYAWQDDKDIKALEPDLAQRFSRGLFFENEAHLDPRLALNALFESLKKADNIALKMGKFADHHDLLQDYDIVVDCAGLSACEQWPELRSVRGEMLLIRCPDITFSRPIRMIHPRIPLYIVPRKDQVFMVGATMIESDDARGPSVRSIGELLNALYALHPAFAEAEIIETKADRRPSLPDNRPAMKREGRSIFINGMYRHGFLMAPILAQKLAAMVAMMQKGTMSETATALS